MNSISLNDVRKYKSMNVVGLNGIELTTNQRPFTAGMVETTIDKYELYLSERNACKNYKMIFSLRPYMSNVLFNPFTEIVYNEGKLESGIISSNQPVSDAHKTFFSNRGLNKLTRSAIRDIEFEGDRRYQLIRDTEYSHPSLGEGVEYHCGLDIFNNHYLRSSGFNAMQKPFEGGNNVFNTIEDFLRDGEGNKVKYDMPNPDIYDDIEKASEGDKTKTLTIDIHMFSRQNCSSIKDAFKNNINDENGWIGFYNRPYALIKNIGGDIVNRCINNKKACTFIDMYPDRTLFSLLPKINYGYLNREEYNWAWFLTYPYESTTVTENGEPFDFFNENGIKIIWNSTSSFEKDSKDILDGKNAVMRDRSVVYFRTKCKHGLKINDTIKLTHPNGDTSMTVVGIGDSSLENKEYYFQLSYDDLADEFGETNTLLSSDFSINYIVIPNDLYLSKLVDGAPCSYYVRKFRKIEKLTSSINKAGFSKTLFNDNIVHLIYDENVSVDGLVDNLGREVSEVFLTLVKKNVGYKEFYHSGITAPNNVEFSHCFGRVTSGFDFECNESESEVIDPKKNENIRDFNVRTLYNLENFENVTDDFIKNMNLYYNVPKPIENDITFNMDVFYGDFVEFSPVTVTEVVLEDVYHRFNTAQRETKIDGNGFPCDMSVFKYDEIINEDFDFIITNNETKIAPFKVDINQNGFRNDKSLYDNTDASPRDNIFPEGYFYKPHYRIKLKEFSETISKGYDTLLKVNPVVTSSIKNFYEIELDNSINISTDNEIVLVYTDKTYRRYYVHSKSTDKKIVFYDWEHAKDEIMTNVEYLYLCNIDIPSYAYYANDGVGKYIWRDLLDESEIPQTSDIYDRAYANGAIYVSNNFNFYLRRQDPYGIYGLKYTYDNNQIIADMQVDGVISQKPDVYYNNQEATFICEI